MVSIPVDGAKALASGTQTGVNFINKHTGDSLAFMYRLPGKALRMASPSAIASATIRPADNTAVPTITPAKISNAKAIKISPRVAPVSTKNKAQWPIHGTITTFFGVAEWPYQAIHTGLDISDGNPAGVTPIHPFKPGRVTQVIHSGYGLGNHIVIDHGSGMTSVYGHLNSVSVHVGQKVNKKSLVGFEGTTGASTGPHLHFEIRINGQAVSPLKYISGHP
jgi:murein DD-endopeptidase MepM/ murein hydrolase activator NlpD